MSKAEQSREARKKRRRLILNHPVALDMAFQLAYAVAINRRAQPITKIKIEEDGTVTFKHDGATWEARVTLRTPVPRKDEDDSDAHG